MLVPAAAADAFIHTGAAIEGNPGRRAAGVIGEIHIYTHAVRKGEEQKGVGVRREE